MVACFCSTLSPTPDRKHGGRGSYRTSIAVAHGRDPIHEALRQFDLAHRVHKRDRLFASVVIGACTETAQNGVGGSTHEERRIFHPKGRAAGCCVE